MHGSDECNLNKVATSRLVLRTMPWGIVEQKQKDEQDVKDVTTYLSGAEGLIENVKRWRSIRASKRCVVVCQGCVSSHLFFSLEDCTDDFSVL